jgi:hypothetical protein
MYFIGRRYRNKTPICHECVTFNSITSLTINQLVAENRGASATWGALPLCGYFRADVTIAAGGAARWKSVLFDRRLKWPREHAICHAESAT